jgi:hypothetical protein
VHLHHPQLDRIEEKLDLLLKLFLRQERFMSQAFDDLSAAVTQETTVEQSVLALLTGLAGQVGNVVTADQAAALKATILANVATMQAAITANTPATPAPAAPPAPVAPPAA